MFLKEIKAHGFKSFADKINIELDNTITGIVGPNGSGKSNVVDAIRWVLGEQSVKSLRGDSHMTDVIFSGSKSRKALNVASVTLVFDNKDSYLSLDFDEVSITRRLYKDGTNEYLINQEKVRLKDITNLLLDTGVGKESFNIISQGKIDEIISTKPNERRVIFEEAAGVLKYKKRKEEALRKLEKTHDNMSRVNDIINELEVQVLPLKEQKEKALKYIDATDELKNIEIALIAEDITTLNNKYQETKEKIDTINAEIVNISTSSTVSSTKIIELKNKINALEVDIRSNQQLLLTITSNVEKINSQKQIILERKKYELEDYKLHDNLVNLKEQKLKYENSLASIDTTINFKKEEIKTLEDTLSKLNTNVSNLKKEKENQENLLTQTIREKNTTSLEIEKLNYSIENSSFLPSSVRSVLNNPKLSGVKDILGNVLQIDELYSLAISTTLGASASNIIVETETSAKEALMYLKQNKLGRATFYPLTVMKERNVDSTTLNSIKNIEGFIDIASSLVHAEKTYLNVVLNQLGNVIVCKDIDSANKISKVVNKRYKIVTLDGQVINVGGSITGGSELKYKNVINEKLDLEINLKKLSKLDNQISIIENKINEIDYQYKIIEDKLYLENKSIFNLKEFIDNKVNTYEEINTELNRINSEINGTNNILQNSLSKEEDEIISKYYEAIKQKELIESTYEKITLDKQKLVDELNIIEFESRQESTLFNSKNKELKDAEISLNRYDVRLDNLLVQLNETYNITYELATTYKLTMDIDSARNKVNNLKRLIKEMGVVNLAAPEEYDRVSQRYEFLIEQKDDLTNAENTLLDIINNLDSVMEKEFMETFNVIKENFTQTFKELFKGGNAYLKLTDESNLLETGVEIVASPPGKKLSSISLLSGGEKTFTAISLLFAILKSRPVPFCILDEVEAALDEVNVDSFGSYLKELNTKTQFILITHKKKTMEYVNTLYGITMQESGVSKLVSVRLEDLK